MLKQPDAPLSRLLPPAPAAAPSAAPAAGSDAASSELSDSAQLRGTTGVSAPSDANLPVPPRTTHPPPQGQGRAPQGVAGGVPSTAILPTPQPPHHFPTRRTKPDVLDRYRETIERVEAKIRLKATTIVNDYMSADEIDDNGMPVEGLMVSGRPAKWSARKHRVAMDGRRPLKFQPGYLQAAVRTLESFHRKEADKAPAPVLNAEVIQIIQTQNNASVYPVIDLEKDDR